jgi:hypothetical protein
VFWNCIFIRCKKGKSPPLGPLLGTSLNHWTSEYVLGREYIPLNQKWTARNKKRPYKTRLDTANRDSMHRNIDTAYIKSETSRFPNTAHTRAITENRAVIRIVLSSGMWHSVKLTSISLRNILPPASSKSKSSKKVACRVLQYIYIYTHI